MFFKKEKQGSYDPTEKKPMIRDEADLDEFRKKYGITGKIEKKY